MTLTIEAIGYDGATALSEMASLFFGRLRQRTDGRIQVPYKERIRIESLISESEGADLVITTTKFTEDVHDNTRWVACDSITYNISKDEWRREAKRQLYVILSRETGLYFPWGALTGIRPTQIACQEIERVAREAAGTLREVRYDDVYERMTRYWHLSEQKAKLVIETAIAEQRLLASLAHPKSNGAIEHRDESFLIRSEDTAYPFVVYVGLPFCPSRCAYCSFIARDAERHARLLEPYVEAVIREVEMTFSYGFTGEVAAVYFGGGTPTSLPAPLFERYLEGVLQSIPLTSDAELTMEAGRPDTIDEEKLTIIRDNKFQRLCINPQTMRDETLKAIGRAHTVKETLKAYDLARAMGFRDINMDLIAGLPGEGAAELLESVAQITKLAPESVTLHTLAVKRGSALIEDCVPHAVFHPDEALLDAVERSHSLLRAHGYTPYYLYRQRNCRSGLENTGFAQEGYASIYNVAMMSDAVPVIGFGSGSTSKAIRGRQAKRVHNPKDLSVYINRVEEQVEKKRALFTLQIE
ncbi:MAG TPA: coproporphyrinogen dehydrogenase HemZ [Clostridiaceae bacterium]|nr:coproporphyrinogen dehydrogenase HemZ [Clostridiaceae bacterium]